MDNELDQPLENEIGPKSIEEVKKPKPKLFLDNPPPYVPIIPFPQWLWKHQKERILPKLRKRKNTKKNVERSTQWLVESAQKVVKPPPYEMPPIIPYPQRLKKSKLEQQFSKFLDIFKKLYINISFMDALEQTPSYVKFIKKILANNKKLSEYETISLLEECSAILKKKLPPKLKDLRSFTIPFSIGNALFRKALCDIGASINLMPLSIFKKLGFREIKPTRVTLQMVDPSFKHLKGIIENVLVKVDKFSFPTNFFVLDMEEDKYIPVILGRPFLATRKAHIDVKKDEFKLSV